MPYDKVKNYSACPAGKKWAVIKRSDRKLMGCHASEAAADRQIAALHASEEK